MAVTINASTSAGLVMTSDLSGVLTLQQNGVSLPNGGVAPAFSAYANNSQTITASTFTKVQLNTEEFDTNNNFDSATNYRFTPTVAGYYQINGQTNATSTSTLTRIIPAIYKNGTAYKYGSDITATDSRSSISSLVYLNGSTDYIEYYVLLNGTGVLSTSITAIIDNYFNGCLVRGA